MQDPDQSPKLMVIDRMGGTHKFFSALSDLYHFYGL